MKIPKSPEEVDELIEAYEAAAGELSRQHAHLIALVEKCGTAPTNATVSKRLEGVRKSVLVTWGSTMTVDEDGVQLLKAYLDEQGLGTIFPRLFAPQQPRAYVPPPPAHRKVGDVFCVLYSLPKRLQRKVEDKIAALYAGAVRVKPKAPSLKLETVE